MARCSTTWIKGQSGNPSGRPKRSLEIQRLFQERSEEAADYFIQVMRDENEKTENRMKAGQIMLERGFGKPGQSVIEEDIADKPPSQMTTQELEAALYSIVDARNSKKGK